MDSFPQSCDPVVWGDDDVTSNASTTIVISVDAAFVRPVTSIVSVWGAAARSFAVKTTTWGSGVGANRSTSPTSTPSRKTRAIPAWGPRKPIQLTDVPVKVNVACAPAVVESAAVPPLHRADALPNQPAVYATDGSVSSKCDTAVGGGDDVTSNAS